MLSSLQVLDLSNNQFSGSLPDELSQLTKVWFSLTASQKIE
jgi:hypothetical protein